MLSYYSKNIAVKFCTTLEFTLHKEKNIEQAQINMS